MRRRTRTLAGFLAIALTVTVLGGCEGGKWGSKDQTEAFLYNGSRDAVVEEMPTVCPENVLHEIKVEPTEKDFVSNGGTDYTIVVPSEAEVKVLNAATLISNTIEAATGAKLEIISEEDAAYSGSQKYIVMDCDGLYEAAGLETPAKDVGTRGYYIFTKDNSVFIRANTQHGVYNGALEFLKHMVGYEVFAEERVWLEQTDSLKLLDFTVIDRPDYELYLASNGIGDLEFTGQRYSHTDQMNVSYLNQGGESAFQHNTMIYLPKSVYQEAHPLWYAGDQLCYTAHGDAEELELMLQEVMKTLTAVVDANPDKNSISFTQMDVRATCECEACSAAYEKYGAYSSTTILFVNRLGELLEEYLKEQAEREGTPIRDVKILFFAYQMTVEPPVKEENGVYAPTAPEMRCRDNVAVYLAPIDAMFNLSFEDEKNAQTQRIIEGWGAVADHIWMWLYSTNFSFYLTPYNSWETMIPRYRFCKANNAVFMYDQGQYNNATQTGFTHLKQYISAKALWDTSVELPELLDAYFIGCYDVAADPMRQFFDELQDWFKYLEENTDGRMNGNIYLESEQREFWPKALLLQWEEYIEEAYEAIKVYQTEEPEVYEGLKKQIKRESIFLQWELLHLYGTEFTESEFQARKDQFVSDCEELNFTYYKEHEELKPVLQALSWGN